MPKPLFQEVEPYAGWLLFYDPSTDERAPLPAGPEGDLPSRYIYTFAANPLWDSIDSESLLVKILYLHYQEGYAVVELLGEWNDLFENDFRLLCERLINPLMEEGVNRFVFICENVFNVYIDATDYYEDLQDRLADEAGWICLLKARPNVQEGLAASQLDRYLLWDDQLDHLRWRKLKPWDLFAAICHRVEQPRLGTGFGPPHG